MILILIAYVVINYISLLAFAAVMWAIPSNEVCPKLEYRTTYKKHLYECYWTNVYLWPTLGTIALVLFIGIKLAGVVFKVDHFRYKITVQFYKGRSFYYVKELDKFFIEYKNEGLTIDQLIVKFGVTPNERIIFYQKHKELRG